MERDCARRAYRERLARATGALIDIVREGKVDAHDAMGRAHYHLDR